MIDLQKEAEQYAKRFQNDSGYDGESCAIEDRIEMEAFIAGATTSKYVQAEKLKAQIEVLEHAVVSRSLIQMYGTLFNLQQQLTQLENETH